MAAAHVGGVFRVVDIDLGVPGRHVGLVLQGAVEMVHLPLDLEGLVPPHPVVLPVHGGGEGEGAVVPAGVLAKAARHVVIRGPQLPQAGRRIPVGRELDLALPAADAELRVRVARLGGPFAHPVLGVAVGAGDIHAAQVVVLDVVMAVLGSECGRDSGRSGGGDQLTGSDLTLHGINGDGPGREDQEDLPGNHHTSRSAAPSCPRRRSEGDVGGTSGIGGDRRRGEGELPARPPQQQARPARPVVRPVARRHWRPDAAHACDAKRRSAAIDVEGIGYIHNMHCTSSSYEVLT
jgi:hypothetical protein